MCSEISKMHLKKPHLTRTVLHKKSVNSIKKSRAFTTESVALDQTPCFEASNFGLQYLPVVLRPLPIINDSDK